MKPLRKLLTRTITRNYLKSGKSPSVSELLNVSEDRNLCAEAIYQAKVGLSRL